MFLRSRMMKRQTTFRKTNRQLTLEQKQNDRTSSTLCRNCLATVPECNTTVVNTNPRCVAVCQTRCICYLQTELMTSQQCNVLKTCMLKRTCVWRCDPSLSLWRFKEQKQETETPFTLLQDTAPSTWLWSWYLRGRKLPHVASIRSISIIIKQK